MNTPRSAALLSVHALILAGIVALAAPQHAEATNHAMGSGTQTMSDMADGEVRKVDKDAKKITLRHGELKQLDMPPMTMVFQVKDPALLDKVKVGDKVKFRAENQGGTMTVTEIEAAK